jgi:hypothetical protein
LIDPEQPGDLPRIFISGGSGGPEPPDRARFARDLIQSMPLRDLAIVSAEPMRIRGTAGYEIKAQSRDPAGSAVRIVQWVRFEGGGYMTILAATGAQDWDRLYPRFRAIRDGIERR